MQYYSLKPQNLLPSLVISTAGCPGVQGSLCALQESISQSCVSSGSSVVGLMVTSSKMAMPYPSLLHPEPHACGSPLLTRPSTGDTHSSVSVSVGSLGHGVHKVCLSPLSISGRNGI